MGVCLWVVGADPHRGMMVTLSHPAVRTVRTLLPGAPTRGLAQRIRQPVSSFPAQKVLAFIPVFSLCYVLLVLPFVGADGQPRIVNILFWPLLAGGTLALALYNRS